MLLRSPRSGRVITVRDDTAALYLSQGWVKVTGEQAPFDESSSSDYDESSSSSS